MSKSEFEAIVDTVISKTKYVTKKVSSKANVAIENAKISFAINDTEKKISELKEKIGDIIFNEYKEGKELDEGLSEYCRMLENLSDDICVMHKKQAELKHSVLCSSCGKLNDDKNAFCAFCGEKLSHKGEE